MDEVVINPQTGYVGLRICGPERFDRKLEYFTVELFDPEVRARTRVYAYEPSQMTAFFDDLARNWRGWPGNKLWESLEGECRMSAANDGKGHIDLNVSLRPSPNPNAWRFDGVVLIEAGQLDSLVRTIEGFVGP